jgi:HK97 gp10 family phage protein
MARVTGIDRQLARLKRASAAVRQEADKALVTAAGLVAAEATASIVAGWKSGPNRVPSRPGEPPNADTGRLHRGIGVEHRGELEVQVVSTAPYARDLEYGTSQVAARPYLRPAVAKTRDKAVDLVRQAIRRGLAKK